MIGNIVFQIIPPLIISYLISIILLLIRVFRGPTIGDQVLAIDVITYFTVLLFVVLSIYFREPILTVTAIPLALWVYALDLYVAKYLEKGELSD